MQRLLSSAVTTLLLTLSGPAGGSSNDAALQAALVYRFVQFSEWPSPVPKKYCVVGDTAVLQALQQLVQPPELVRAVSAASAAQQCQVLFLGRYQAPAADWAAVLAEPAVLSVAATREWFMQGALFGFITEPKQIAFRVNLSMARSRGYQLNARMLKLAKEIY